MSDKKNWKLLQEYDNSSYRRPNMRIWEENLSSHVLYWLQIGDIKEIPTEEEMRGMERMRFPNSAWKFNDLESAQKFVELSNNLFKDYSSGIYDDNYKENFKTEEEE